MVIHDLDDDWGYPHDLGKFPPTACCPDHQASLQLYEGNLLGAVGMLRNTRRNLPDPNR